MILLTLLSLTPLIGLPYLHDGFSLPKTAYIVFLSSLCLLALLLRRGEISVPLAAPLSLYLGAIALSVFGATNLHAFFSQFSLDVAGIVIFVYIVNFVERRHVVLGSALLSAGVLAGSFMLYDGAARAEVAQKFYGLALVALIPTAALALFSKRLALPGTLFILVSLYQVYWADSKTAIVALVLLCPALLFVAYRREARILPIPSFFVASLLVVAALFALSFQYHLAGRVKLWEISLSMLPDLPWYGLGRGNWFIEYGKLAPQAHGWATLHAHSDLLELFIESGPIAALGLVWFVASVLFLKAGSPLGISLQLGVFVLFSVSFFWPMAYSGFFVYLFWTLCGLSWVENATPKS